MTAFFMDERLRAFISSTRKKGDSAPFFPLCLGVSGHRKIEEFALNKVRCGMADFLWKAASEWQQCHQTGENSPDKTAVLLLCGLARGADTLAAKEILRLKSEHPELNYKLVAVLPMPMDHYKEDFTKEPDRETFYELIQKADCVLDLPLTPENQSWSDQYPNEKLPMERRISQYGELAKFLAKNSACLLALWDGIGINLNGGQMTLVDEGGTAEVVYLKLKNPSPATVDLSEMNLSEMNLTLESGAESLKIFSVLLTGSVVQIATPRRKRGQVQLAPDLVPGEVRGYVCANENIRIFRWMLASDH